MATSDIGTSFFRLNGGEKPILSESNADEATPTSTSTDADENSPAVSISISARTGRGGAGGDLWYQDPSDGLYGGEGGEGFITHIAAKASGSCPYMRELLGLPPLPALANNGGANNQTLALTPPIRPNGLLNEDASLAGDDSASPSAFTNSPATLSPQRQQGASQTHEPSACSLPPPYHQSHAYHHPHYVNTVGMATLLPPNHPRVPVTASAALGCPFLSGKGKSQQTATNTEGGGPASAPPQGIVGTCPVTGKTGPLPKGHPAPPTTNPTDAAGGAPDQKREHNSTFTAFANSSDVETAVAAGCPYAAKFAKAQAQHGEQSPISFGGPAPFSLDGGGENSSSVVNTSAVSNLAVVAISAPSTALALPIPSSSSLNGNTIHDTTDATTRSSAAKCPFINVFANHIDSFLHRALMTSVLNRITLKSFLREKKVLQKFAINSAIIGKKGRSRQRGGEEEDPDGAAAVNAQREEADDDEVDESAHAVLSLSEEAVEAKCNEVLQVYIAKGTARTSRIISALAEGPADDKIGDREAGASKYAATSQPKLTPAVAAILAAAAANAAHLPPALRHGASKDESDTKAESKTSNVDANATSVSEGASNQQKNDNTEKKKDSSSPRVAESLVPPAAAEDKMPSGANTPNTIKARRIVEIEEDHDATVGATPSAVASMLSTMRLGKEICLPMGLSFLHQATTRSEERFADMYLRVVSEACGIKSNITPPLRPPARITGGNGSEGHPNPAALMVMVPPASLLTGLLADGRLSVPGLGAGPTSAQSEATADGAAPSQAPTYPSATKGPSATVSTAPPPKTFLHDVLCDLFVPRMRHFYTLWLHAVEALDAIVENGEDEEKQQQAVDCGASVENEEKDRQHPRKEGLADALHRVKSAADDLVHCLRIYSKMLHYHIMDPSSMRLVIEDLIARANQFVTAKTEREKLRLSSAAAAAQAKKRETTTTADGKAIGEHQATTAGVATYLPTAPIHVYPAAHRFFALATIFAIRESVPFRSLIAMEMGEGAELRESIVAELIRGDKMLQMGSFVERGSVTRPMTTPSTEEESSVATLNNNKGSLEVISKKKAPVLNYAPIYAHPSSARQVLKAALYVTALATISPVMAAAPPTHHNRPQQLATAKGNASQQENSTKNDNNHIVSVTEGRPQQQESSSARNPTIRDGDGVNVESLAAEDEANNKNTKVTQSTQQQSQERANATPVVAGKDGSSSQQARGKITTSSSSPSTTPAVVTNGARGSNGGNGGKTATNPIRTQQSSNNQDPSLRDSPNQQQSSEGGTTTVSSSSQQQNGITTKASNTNNTKPKGEGGAKSTTAAAGDGLSNTAPIRTPLTASAAPFAPNYNNNNLKSTKGAASQPPTIFSPAQQQQPNLTMYNPSTGPYFNPAAHPFAHHPHLSTQPIHSSGGTGGAFVPPSGGAHHYGATPSPSGQTQTNNSHAHTHAMTSSNMYQQAPFAQPPSSENSHSSLADHRSRAAPSLMVMVAPFTNVPLDPSTSSGRPLAVPFAPFLQYQQQQQQNVYYSFQNQQQQGPQQQQQRVNESATSVVAAHYAAMQEANRKRMAAGGVGSGGTVTANTNNAFSGGNVANFTAPPSLSFVPTISGQPHQQHFYQHAPQSSQDQQQQQQALALLPQPQTRRSQVPPFYTTTTSSASATPAMTTPTTTTTVQLNNNNNSNNNGLTSTTMVNKASTSYQHYDPAAMYSSAVAAAPPATHTSSSPSASTVAAGFPSPFFPYSSASASSVEKCPFLLSQLKAGGAPPPGVSPNFYYPTAMPYPHFTSYTPQQQQHFVDGNGTGNNSNNDPTATTAMIGHGSHLVSSGGISVSPEVIAAVEELVAPVYQPKKGNGSALAPPSYSVATTTNYKAE